MNFASDNWAGAHPAVMAAVAAANDGPAPGYGSDLMTRRVEETFSRVFERDVAVFFVSTGGAANALALAALTPPWGMILAHQESHAQMDECGAPEFYTGGAKILPLPGRSAKLDAETVARALSGFPERPPHGCPPRAMTITQATECGAVYRRDELIALAAVARDAGLKVHMDGARFANALATTGESAAASSWRAGVDALSFGGTKNGCLVAEAILFFDRALAGDTAFRRKRGGHLWSKSRYIAAQFDAYFRDDLWLRLASHANAMARRLADGIAAIAGCRVWHPTEANAVFASFPGDAAARLRAEGATFYPWVTPDDPSGAAMHRLICSWATTKEDVDRFLAAAHRCAKAAAAP